MKVALIFGGRSAEHEISLESAKNILFALKKKYTPILIGISRSGKWYLLEEIPEKEVVDGPDSLSISPGKSNNFLKKEVDIVFPVLHGLFGEDGTIQGLLKLIDIPFVGSSVLGSAVAMDKEISKNLLRQAGISTVNFTALRSVTNLNKVHNDNYPFFVKPANLGSSIGVSKVFDRNQMRKAVLKALQYDKKVLVEDAINGRELECSVLGNEAPIASKIGEIKSIDFYSYKAKYLSKDAAKLIIPAVLDKEIEEKIQKIALKSFKVLECEGMARVDFFLTENKILVNEVNAIPGFTNISMYPKLWEVSGINCSDLITKLIDLGIERYKNNQNLRIKP